MAEGGILMADNQRTGPGSWEREPDMAWMERARCRDVPPEVFFPRDGVGVEAARRYCAECPVTGPCLEYALVNRIEHGVWGGASERQRRRIAQSRRAKASRWASGGKGAEEPGKPATPATRHAAGPGAQDAG